MGNAGPDSAVTLRAGMLVCLREAIAPELWRVYEVEGRIAQLNPVSLGATKQQVPVRDLRRYQIKTTDQVFFKERLVVPVRVRNPRSGDLYTYDVRTEEGGELTLREHEMTVHAGSEAPDPVAQLANLDAAPAALAAARVGLLHAYFAATARSLGIVGYNGARMLPIPHQVSAARYALLFGRPRLLLADEVGLGKTVEAGLIVSTLRKYFPEWKTAFFVPESLTVQWAFEMYGKFGKAIFRLADDEEPEEGDDDPGVILAHGRAAEWAEGDRADILVVDEAHQTLRDPKTLEALTKLSREAHAVLLLTATPTSDDNRNLFRLLRLSDPDFFARFEHDSELDALFDKRGAVEAFLRALRDADIPGSQLIHAWEALAVEDEELDARLMALAVDDSDMKMRHRLASLATDRLHPGARILRYQRKFLALDNEMAERIEEPIVYTPDSHEKKAMAVVRNWLRLLPAHHASDAGEWLDLARILVHAAHSSPLALQEWAKARLGRLPAREGVSADPVWRHRRTFEEVALIHGEEEIVEELEAAAAKWAKATRSPDIKQRALARLPRYVATEKAVKALLRDDDAGHLIVFTSFEGNVKALQLLLNKALGEDVEVFALGAEMEWRAREKAAFAFQECRTKCVLVSDDLGGEGRNFQIATALLHFDMPPASWVLEQRIGRLDRVGRDPEMDVDSQVLVSEGGLDEAVYNFQRDAVGVFNESVAPVEDMLDEVVREMMTALVERGAEGVEELVEPVRERLAAHREKEVEALLARADTGVSDVKKLVPLLEDRDELRDLARATVRYTRLLGSVVDDSDRVVTITVGSHHPLSAVLGVLPEMQGTFDRRLAVRHERREFFSTGHPFVRALARGALQDSGDRVGFFRRKGIPHSGIVFSFRVNLPMTFLESVREQPGEVQTALLCSAAGQFPTWMRRVVVSFEGKLVDEGKAAPWLEPYREDEASLDEGPEVLNFLPARWGEICAKGAEAARGIVERDAAEVLKERVGVLEDLMEEVMTRHHGAEVNVESMIETLLFDLDPLSVDLDSAMVIVPG